MAQSPASQPQVTPAASDGASQEVGEIIVTAQKRSERLRDVPMSVNAASGDQLKALGVTQPEQLEKVVPGFSVNKTQYGLPVFYIRGIGFNDTSLGASPAVSSYVDQIPIPYAPMARGAGLDVERVEVLKGPQGTLFGQNSTGGAINFVAAKPTDTLKAGFDLSYGRFNEVDFETHVSGPISDTLSARIALRNESRDPWQRGYTNGDELGRRNFKNGRLTLDFHPGDVVHVQLTASGWRDRSDAQQPQLTLFKAVGPLPLPYPLATFPTTPNDARAAAWDPGRDFRNDNWFYQFGGRVDINLSDTIALTSLTSYSKFAQHVLTDFDATVYPEALNAQNGRIDSFSQELRLSGSVDNERLKWMIGGNYQRDKVFEELVSAPIVISSVPIIDSFRTDNLQRVKTKSVFGSIDYKVTNNVTLQGSVRYTRQDRDFEGCLRDNGNGTAAFFANFLYGYTTPLTAADCLTQQNGQKVPFATGKLNEDNVSWRAGVTWKPNDAALIYANVTKGYKSGSFPTIPYLFQTDYAPVKQESVLAYEVGTKLSLVDRVLQVDGALFYYDYRDKQLNGYISTAIGLTQILLSVPKATVKGAELSATLRPFSGFTLTANGTYIHTRIDQDPVDRVTGVTVAPYGFTGVPGSYVGLPFSNTPEWQGTVDAQYRFPVSSALDAYVGTTFTHRSSTSGVLQSRTASDALVAIPEYGLLDLRAGVETGDGKWRAEIWGRNVTNKYYLVGTYRAADYYARFSGMPATYGVSVFFRY